MNTAFLILGCEGRLNVSFRSEVCPAAFFMPVLTSSTFFLPRTIPILHERSPCSFFRFSLHCNLFHLCRLFICSLQLFTGGRDVLQSPQSINKCVGERGRKDWKRASERREQVVTFLKMGPSLMAMGAS